MKKYFLIIPLFLITIFIALFVISLRPPSTDTTKKVFVINQGEELLTIGNRLQKYNFINNKYSFYLYSYLLGLNNKLQAGTFYLTTSQKLPDLIKKLATGGSTDYWFKIIPGQRLEQFSPDDDFSVAAKDLEGQLFPDSYLIPENYSTSQIIDIVLTNYETKLAQAKENSTSRLSDPQNLILASLLEREARTLSDKKIIAGIILNRLNNKMPLQLDASVQYAKDTLHEPEIYWQPITKSDLSINSSYNTYKNSGLPPSPICNPGFDSLFASYHPSSSNYLYYLNDSSGQIHYATNLSEHNANVAKYLR